MTLYYTMITGVYWVTPQRLKSPKGSCFCVTIANNRPDEPASHGQLRNVLVSTFGEVIWYDHAKILCTKIIWLLWKCVGT